MLWSGFAKSDKQQREGVYTVKEMCKNVMADTRRHEDDTVKKIKRRCEDDKIEMDHL